MSLVSNLPTEAAPAPSVTPEILSNEFRRNMGQISRHSLTFFAGTIFTMGAGYLVKIYVARVLGAEQLGLYALGMTLVSLTQLVSNLGLQGTAARYVAVYNATGKFEELRGFLTRSVLIVVSLTLIFSIGLVVAGGWIASHLYHAPSLSRYMTLFAMLTVLGAVNALYCQILAGFKDITKRTVITNFIGTPLVILLTVLLLAWGTGMQGYLWAQIGNSVVVVALLVGVGWRLTPPAARFSSRPLPPVDPEIKAFAAAAFGMSAIEFLVTQADKVLLGFYLTPALVGVYVVASTVSALIPLVLQSVNQIFAPVVADLHSRSRIDVLQRIFQTLTKWVLGLTLPLVFVIITFAAPMMRLFGPAFESGWPVLVIASIGQIVNCAVGSVGQLLFMSGNQRRLIKVQFFMVGISLLMNVALIPALGVVGAALAAASVNIVGNVWNLVEVRKALGILPYNRSYFALAIPCLFSIGAAHAVKVYAVRTTPAWIVMLVALLLSYVVFAVFALKFSLADDDRMIAASAWAQVRGNFLRR